MGRMSSPALDTLKAARVLRAAGFDDAQAEAVITTVSYAAGENVATRDDVQALKRNVKDDIQALRAEFKEDIQALRAEFKEDIRSLELRVAAKFESLYQHLWFMGAGIVTANAAFVTALIKLL